MLYQRSSFSRSLLHTAALCALLCAHSHVAQAEPQGGAVTSGSAAISTSGATTTINQSSDRAIIRWDSFDINNAEHVKFLQPSSSSLTVNRIRDTKASTINGKITANGNIILINPNGLIFGASSIVDVGSLVATTSDLEDDHAFMAGGAVKFTKPGNIDAKIITNGNITVREAGLVGLVAPHVENNGIIQARLGKVQLASGDIHTIDFAGDGLIKLEISDAVVSQSVKNTGQIFADGGDILLTASVARHIVNTIVTNTGTLQANTVTMPDGALKIGSITMTTHGLGNEASLPDPALNVTQVVNTGLVFANGNGLNQIGGLITLLADNVLVGDGSYVEAAGDVGGGAIRIGGDYQGGGSLPTSDMIFISEHAILNADTRRRGRGGTIILWSDENTRFYGDASAQGGSEEGNGGLIEVSSKKYLDFNGTVNLKAANGQNGTLLLDPTNITISTGANTDVTGSSPFTPSADNATSVLNITTLQAALAGGNVIVQTRATGGQAGTITVANTLSWSSGNTLTLDAHDAITVNAAIAAGTGSLTMIAGGDVALNANVTGSGTITIRQANDALTMGLAGGAGTLNLSAADLNRIVDGWGSVVLGRATSTVTLTANARTWADNVTLLSGTGAINLAGTQTIGGNNLTVTSVGGAVTLAGLSGTTGQLSVDSGGGTISISGASATTGAVSLLSGGGNISTSATLGSGALTMTSGGGVITIGGNITATGATNLTSGAGEININAALNAGANALTLSSANANITSNASGAITGGVVNITTGDGNLQTGAALTSSGIMTINTGAGLLSLGAATSSTAAAMNLTTTARAISTAALTSGALSVNSNGANIGIGAITASGNSTITSGIGSISISGAANTGANSLSLSATNNTVTTAAITSGALSMTSGGGAIQTGGIVAANGITNINSGGGAMTLNAAFGSGTGAMTLTTGGGTLTTFSGNLSSAALTITTSGGNVAIGNGGITATGIGSIITGAGTFGSTGAINTGTSALGITTTARTITTAAITAGALTLASGGANIQTGALTISGTSSITSGAATISIGAVTGGANALTLSSTGFGITTAAITSGNLSIASAGGIITTGGAIAAAGTLGINSGAAAMNLNSAVTSTGTMTLTTTGAAITKNGTGAMSSGALNITTAGGNISLSPTTLTTTGATTMNAGTGSITVGSAWTATGQTIGLTTTGNTVSLSTVSSAALTINSNGGAVTLGATTTSGILTVNSGAGNVSLNGAVATAANAINITTTGGSISKSANITSTGAITFTSGGGLISIGTGTMGSASTGSVTLNSGGGNITIGGSGISYTTGGAVSMNSGAAGVITINNAIATGTGALTITTDTNIAINAALNGTGALTIQQFSAATGIGIGAAQAGAVNISAAEFALIATTRSSRTFGRVDGTGDINIAGTTTWADPLVLRSSTGVINFNGAQNFGANNLTITTDADILVGGTLTGAAGTMTIAQQTNATTIGLGTGQAGTIAFNNTELGYLTNGWASVIIGSTTATGDMNIGTMTWNDPMTFRSNTGIINVNGVQTMAVNNGLAFNTNSNLNLGANIIGSGTGALTISTIASSATTMGFGDTMVGTLNLTNAELARIVNGWASITLGSTTAAGAINVGAYTWNDALSIASNSGAITLGTTTMSAGNALTLSSNVNINLGGNITGTTTLTIQGVAAATTMGIGDGEAGTIALTNAELNYIQNGWSSIVLGASTATGLMNVGNYTWQDNLTLRNAAGIMSIDGVTMGTNNLTISTNGNLALNGALTGTGTLTIRTTNNATIMALGDSQTGAVQISAAELANIQSGWSSVVFGQTAQTGAINVGAMTWGNNITYLTNTGAININDAQQMGTNNLTFTTNGNPAIAAGLAGTGNLLFQVQAAATIMGIGTGQAGAVQFSNTDLGNILNGWNSIVFGSVAQTGAINIGAYTWQYDTIFRNTGGAVAGVGIIIAGDQDGRNLTYETNANIQINANLTGTGTLTIRGATAGATVTVGGAPTGNTLMIDNTELGRITDGWEQLIFGRSDNTGTFTANAVTWNDNVKLMTGAGVMTIAGIQDAQANDLTLAANSNIVVSAALTGTGNLAFEGSITGTTIGLAGAAGTLGLSAAELNFITDGWASQTYGSVLGTGLVTVGAYTWKDNATFISNGNISVTGAQGSNASTDLVYASLGGNFLNSAGATVFNTVGAGGRYLIYSTSAGTDTYGGFTPPTSIASQTYFSMAPSSVGAGLNRIIYNQGAAKILYLQIDDKSKVYGDTLPTFTYTYLGGLVSGDTLGAALTGATLTATGASATDGVGVLRTITGIFSTALGYTTQVIDGLLSVTKAPVLVSSGNAAQAYGDTNPGSTITYTGLRNGELASTPGVLNTLAIASSGTDEFSNAGTYSILVSGASADNYTFNYSPGTLTINKAVLTGTTQDATREYYSANPTLNIVYTGFKNGDDETDLTTLGTAATTAVLASNAGSYAITGSGGTATNYTFSYANTGQLTVTKAVLNATTQDATREYGLANPAMSIVYTGFKGADTVAVVSGGAASSAAVLGSNVGTYAITGAGATATNYSFNYVDSGVLSVTKATLTATTQNASREYGLANSGLTINYTGFRAGDDTNDIDTLGVATSAADQLSNVGVYAGIVGSGAVDDNYDFTYTNTGALTITKATLVGTTQNATREYGLANPALSIIYTGFRNTDTQTDIDVLGTAATAATAVSGIGNYAITGSGGSDGNYNLTYANTGLLSVTQAVITVTAQDATREYGLANPALSAVYTGYRNGEDISVVTSLATIATPATLTSNAGNYAITASGANAVNYSFNYVDGNLAVTKATLTATSQNATREYGAAAPAYTFSYTGFRNTDGVGDIDTQAAGSTPGATILTNVGSGFQINGSGAVDNNYNFTYVNTGSLSITKATLTVTADDKSREVLEPDPALTATYTGFRNSDGLGDVDVLATLTTTANASSPVGSYAITASGASDGNYNFNYVNGTFSVVPEFSAPPPASSGQSSAASSIPSTAERTAITPAYVFFDPGHARFVSLTEYALGDLVFVTEADIRFYQQNGDYPYLLAISQSLQNDYFLRDEREKYQGN